MTTDLGKITRQLATIEPDHGAGHDPIPGTVTDRHGHPCPRATDGSYPLSAWCTCGSSRPLRTAAGSADWTHGAIALEEVAR